MIQDKIFFDEKDPTGLSYNTPFTYYGSYQGRLWSKSPSGSIQYYTQNSDLSIYATTGSNQFSGSQTVTGSLTVTGTITGTVAGTTSTASYVEYTNVANKPALVSGSSQVTYSGLTGIPSGIVSGSAQIASFGIFATTGSNGFNGSQSITGSLTVTGQVVAQTLNVQQVTSSVVYSSGSNIFGNELSNTQQFTGSVGMTGSLTVAGAGTFTGALSGTSAVFSGDLTIDTNTLFVDSTNNRVGIGTTSTTYKLDVSGSGSMINIIGASSGDIATGFRIGRGASLGAEIYDNPADNITTFNTTGGLNLRVGGSNRLTIASTGAATFNSSVTSPVVKLSDSTLSGAGNFEFTSEAFFGARFQSNAYKFMAGNNSTEYMRITSDGYLKLHRSRFLGDSDICYIDLYNPNTGNLSIINTSSDSTYGNIILSTNNTERMRITSAGNVGIGTASPGYKLDVNGDIRTSAILYTTDSGPSIYQNRINAGWNSIGDSIDLWINYEGYQNGLDYFRDFRVGNGKRGSAILFIDGSNGSSTFSGSLTVGKGITVSSDAFGNYFGKFGAASTSLLELREFTGDQTGTTLILRSSRSNSGNLYAHIQAFSDSSTQVFRVLANGVVDNLTGAYGSLSDIKLKENIVDATPKLEDLLKVKIRNYNLIGEENKQIGVIAQELEEIFPGLVSESEDFKEVETTDEEGNTKKEKQSLGTTTKSVKYSIFIPMLIKAMQELSAKVETLESEIQTLKQQ